MRKWLTVPPLEDAYQRFAFSVLHYTLPILILVSLTFTAFASSLTQFIFVPIVVALFGGCFYLLHTNRYWLSSHLFIGGLWTIITGAAFALNGVRNAAINTYVVVIIFSAVLISNHVALRITALSVLAVVILGVGETLDVLPLNTTPLYLADRVFQQIGIFLAAGILLSATSRTIRANFARLRLSEQELQAHNQQLEREARQREQIAADLRASEERYRILFEAIPVVAIVCDADGNILLANSAAGELLHGSPQALTGKHLDELVAAKDSAAALGVVQRVLESGNRSRFEHATHLADGRQLFLLHHVAALPHTTTTNQPQALVLSTDLTEHKLAEERERALLLANEKNAFFTDFFQHDVA